MHNSLFQLSSQPRKALISERHFPTWQLPTHHDSDSLVHHGGGRVQTGGVFPHVQGWAAETQSLLAAGKWMC